MIDSTITKIPNLYFTWLGQGGFIFEYGGKSISIDAYLSHRCESQDEFHISRRLLPIPIQPSDLKVDAFISTHDHDDHLDPDTVSQTSRDFLYLGPDSCIRHFKALGISDNRLKSLNIGESVQISEDFSVTGVFAEHTSEDAIGVIIKAGGSTVYVSGDTMYTSPDKMNEVKKYNPDVMFVCINGRLGNMDFWQARDFAAAVKTKVTVPMHYGMFRHNNENPDLFCELMEQIGMKTYQMMFNCKTNISEIIS